MTAAGAMPRVRRRILELEDSGIRKIAHLGMGDPDVIPLWFGEPDMPTPDFIIDACDRALRDGHTFYTPNLGVPELRQTLADYTTRLYGVPVAVDRISVTAAGMNALMCLAEALIDPGDNIVLISPMWPNFFRCIEIMDGEARTVPLRANAGGWRIDLDQLFDACDARTRAICVNSPSNPTGWMMPREDQQRVLDFCRERGLWVIADEVYARIVYDRPHAPSFLEIAAPDDPVIVVNSFSKSWAMSGWRLGWVTAPASFAPVMEKLIEYNVASPGTGAQYAGIAAVRDGEDFVKATVDRYRVARDTVHQRLGAMRRVHLPPPEAAFYAFFEVDGMSDAAEFAKEILLKTKVGLAPGTAFGAGGDTYLRICYAKSPALLGEALDRLATVLD